MSTTEQPADDWVLTDDRLASHRMKIGGMSCSFCTSTIRKAFQRMDGVHDVGVSLAHEEGLVKYDPHKVTPEQLEALFDDADRGANATITVDLEAQEIRGPDGGTVKFDIDPFRKHCLVNGLDDIGLTMQKGDKIDSYEAQQNQAQPWLNSAPPA